MWNWAQAGEDKGRGRDRIVNLNREVSQMPMTPTSASLSSFSHLKPVFSWGVSCEQPIENKKVSASFADGFAWCLGIIRKWTAAALYSYSGTALKDTGKCHTVKDTAIIINISSLLWHESLIIYINQIILFSFLLSFSYHKTYNVLIVGICFTLVF